MSNKDKTIYKKYEIELGNNLEDLVPGYPNIHLFKVQFTSKKHFKFKYMYENCYHSSNVIELEGPGFVMYANVIDWNRWYEMPFPEKFKVIYYPYPYENFKHNQLKAENDFKIYLFEKIGFPKEILKIESCLNNHHKGKINMDEWHYSNTLSVSIKLPSEFLRYNNLTNSAILILGEESKLLDIKILENNFQEADKAIDTVILPIETLEDLKVNELKSYGIEKIDHHLKLLIKEKHITEKYNSKYFMSIIQIKNNEKVLDLPGGTRDLGESSLECCLRELYEETGNDTSKIKILKGIKFEEKKGYYFTIFLAEYT